MSTVLLLPSTTENVPAVGLADEVVATRARDYPPEARRPPEPLAIVARRPCPRLASPEPIAGPIDSGHFAGRGLAGRARPFTLS